MRRLPLCATLGALHWVPTVLGAAWSEGDSVAWPKYPGRRLYVLNGEWDFAFLGDVSQAAAVEVRDEELSRKVSVPDAFDAREWLCPAAPGSGQPHCAGESRRPCGQCCDVSRGKRDESCFPAGSPHTFEKCCAPTAIERRGVAAYRTFLPRDVSLLHFRACSMHCRILVDRQVVEEHVGGYTPFWVELPTAGRAGAQPPQERELLVIVDNRFLPAWPVHQPYFDWYQPGGLLRAVEAHALRDPTAYLHHVHVIPVMPAGAVELRIKLGDNCVRLPDLKLSVAFDANAPVAAKALVDLQSLASGELAWQAQVPEARLWSPEAPQLHQATVALLDGQVEVDRLTVRFGLRYVEVTKDAGLHLNGAPLVLRGVNRHEMNPLGGISLPQELLQRDLRLLKELGANFVRGSHYSQDQRWLDLCDEHGIMVWEETLGWQPTVPLLTDKLFVYQQLVALDETINASMNHPSVIMWGFLNEGQSDKVETRDAYQVLGNFARSRDPSRLVTWASKTKTRDLTLDMADVISFNDYPGWYEATIQEIPGVWRGYAEWARRQHPGKPLIVGETGGDGLVGLRSEDLARWSEDFQAEIVQAAIVAAEAAGFVGIALWQFTDCRIDASHFFLDNPTIPNQELREALLEHSLKAAQAEAEALKRESGGKVDVASQFEESARARPVLNATGSDWVEEVAWEFGATVSPLNTHRPLRPRKLNSKGLVSQDRRYLKAVFPVVQEAFTAGACGLSGNLGYRGFSPSGYFRLSVAGAVAAGKASCIGCFLSVNTWNDADRLQGTAGVRAHVHKNEKRAAHWVLESGGLLRLAGHSDGRQMSLGDYVAVGGLRRERSFHVAAREAAASLWSLEEATPGAQGGPVLLRVAFGRGCGGYLSWDDSEASDQRDEQSFFVHVQPQRHLASLWTVSPLATTSA
eukprot:TRINITY_DN73368_c0_g1_i1.p1 TRINITY_DN73368_c0_g1~~TRINITY_DN73368_c0_g1_i1.p1  ORF type:complete len:918 (+),score=183.94 TRINITY_DN73368_c0_g1_i1:152-2905(+)